jgi:tRNA A-37 threonylcarbamoyl transferase component Bud32
MLGPASSLPPFAGTRVPDAVELFEGPIAGRYQVERELGRGASAFVYLARDEQTGEHVALKVLRPDLAESLGAERFLREIRLTQDLDHPHIVRVLDSGAIGGQFFCVLPYLDGGTLRDRLDRERQLPLTEVVTVARAMGAALAYAHQRKVIHRDVKPENMLFGEGVACLADFGIARAVEIAGGATTSTGVVRGTPAYMSPEQASGERQYDGRSDLYSLACVLYEAVAGMPAFVGPNAQAVLAQRLIHVPRPVRVYRPAASAALEAVLVKALAIAPADRYQTVAEFVEEFVQAAGATRIGDPLAAPVTTRHRRWSRRRTSIAAVAVTLTTTSGWAMRAHFRTALPFNAARTLVVPPLTLAGGRLGADAAAAIQRSVKGELSRWRDLDVADWPNDQRASVGADPSIAMSQVAAVATRMSAGRFVTTETEVTGDSALVHLRLYATNNISKPIATANAQVLANRAIADGAIEHAVDQLLFPGQPFTTIDRQSTAIAAALNEWRRGQRALQTWQFDEADSALAHAVRLDSGFVRAGLWLAIVRQWSGQPSAGWKALVVQWRSQFSRLAGNDSLVGIAMALGADSSWARAAAIWRQLATTDGDFPSWFGLGYNLRRDNNVVPDARSPSGWRFESSANETAQAFRHAFALTPPTEGPSQPGGFDRVKDLLYASTNQVRRGATVGKRETMLASPSWAGDTLVFVPYPAAATNTITTRTTTAEALEHQRRTLIELAGAWISTEPRNPVSFESLALAMQLLGEPGAIDTLRRGRSMAETVDDRLRLAGEEVLLGTAQAVSHRDTGALRRAVNLADSLLAHPSPTNPQLFAGLTALRGRANAAATFAAQAEIASADRGMVPAAGDGARLLVYAAFDGPSDSLGRLFKLVAREVDGMPLPKDRAQSRENWLLRSARMTFPDQAELAARRGDTASVRVFLTTLTATRRDVAAQDIPFETVLPEAQLFLAVADTAGATRWLDRALDAVQWSDPRLLSQPVNVATLVRAMALRARLARRADPQLALSMRTLESMIWDARRVPDH